VISGLSREGCEVEVKPGNASCKFRALNEEESWLEDVYSEDLDGAEGREHVASDGRARMELRDIELRGADRTCTVAITVQEPRQAPKTVYRGFRLSPRVERSRPSGSVAVPVFTCYLSSSSRLARSEGARSRK
jgi:hypothetical protein